MSALLWLLLVLPSMRRRGSTQRLVKIGGPPSLHCVSIDDMMGRETASFFKRIADQLSAKWDKAYDSMMGWIHTRSFFAILCATLLCIQGCHTRWYSLGVVDGHLLMFNY